MISVSSAAAAHHVDCEVMAEANEEAARFANVLQQLRTGGQLAKELLQDIARVVLVTGKIEEEPEKRLSMLLVEPFKVALGRHAFRFHGRSRGKTLTRLVALRLASRFRAIHQ